MLEVVEPATNTSYSASFPEQIREMTNITVAKYSIKPFASNEDILVFGNNYEGENFIICSYSESDLNILALFESLDHL